MYYSCTCQARMHVSERREMCGKTRVLMGTKMHKFSSCKPKYTSAVRANQRCTRAVRANYDTHGSRLMSHVYTRALNTIDCSCIRKLFCEYFQKRVELCNCLTCV